MVIANIMRNCFIAIILLVLFPVSAFSADDEDKPESAPAKNSPPVVIATIKPIHSLVASVMGELAQPELLVDGKNSEHDYALKPSDMKKMQKADVIFFTSLDLETFLVNAIPSLNDGTVAVELAASQGVKRQQVGDSAGEHDKDSYDPHVWLSPENSIAMVKQIAKILALKDKKNRGIYDMNAKKTISKIASASEKITLKLSPYKNVPFITFHDAFGYFVKTYGLNQVMALSLNPETALGAEKISDVNSLVKRKRILCVFSDPAFGDASVKKILNKPEGVKISPLDPAGINIPKGENAYLTILDGVANNMLSCLGDGSV